MIGKGCERHIDKAGYGEFPTQAMPCYLDTLLVELALLIVLFLAKQLCFHKCCRGLCVAVVHQVVQYELALSDDSRGQISRPALVRAYIAYDSPTHSE